MSVRPTTSKRISGTTATVATAVVVVVIGFAAVRALMSDGQPSTPPTGALALLSIAVNVLVVLSFLVLVLRWPTWPRGVYFGVILIIAGYAIFGSAAEPTTPSDTATDTDVVSLVIAAAIFIVPALYMRLRRPSKYASLAKG